MQSPDYTLLDKVRVALIEPTHPGNIGAAARAMANMGARDLALVNPRDFPSAQATARAAGADDVLENASVSGALDEAIADCQLVLGASARSRSVEWPELTPAAAMRKVAATAAAGGRAALLFGRESRGLTNRELDRCHYLVRIPANPDFSSLNLAAAVLVLCYELRLAAAELVGDGDGDIPPRHPRSLLSGGGDGGIHPVTPAAPALKTCGGDESGGGDGDVGDGVTVGDGAGRAHRDRPAPDAPAVAADMQRFYRHLRAVVDALGFGNGRSEKLHRKLTRLFNRARPTNREIRTLRGLLSAIERQTDGGAGGISRHPRGHPPRHPRSLLSGGEGSDGGAGDGDIDGGDGGIPPRHPRSPLSEGGDIDGGDGGVGDTGTTTIRD